MYSTSLRHSAFVQKPSGVAARLLSSTSKKVRIGKAGSFGGVKIPGLPQAENVSESTETSTGTVGTNPATPSDPIVVNNEASVNTYARHLNKYKAGQSPATFYPGRTRSLQPGLSWLGHDEFESTGLAFKLARHHMQRVAAGKPTGGSGFNKNANKNANPGSGPRKNYEKPRTQAKPPQPKKDLAQKSRPKQVDATRTETLRAVKPDVSGGSTTYSILGSSPAPQTIVHVELESTDFASLFGASPSLSASPSTASLKTTPTDAASRRVQLILEYQGGDYSKLVPNSLVTSQGSPLVYAESTMARRRELGPNRRNDALGIVRGMIDKSQGSQPTA